MDRWSKHQSHRSSQNSLFLKFHIYNCQRALPLKKKEISLALLSLIDYLQITAQELALYFVSEKKISELHAQFFDDPTPTDCITFPVDTSYLGEIFICPATAIAYAKKRALNPYEETLLYIVHGLLHLIGYSDFEPKMRRTMRKKEKNCMRHLKKQGFSLGRFSS